MGKAAVLWRAKRDTQTPEPWNSWWMRKRHFYFLEVNTRLRWNIRYGSGFGIGSGAMKIRIAAGDRLTLRAGKLHPRGTRSGVPHLRGDTEKNTFLPSPVSLFRLLTLLYHPRAKTTPVRQSKLSIPHDLANPTFGLPAPPAENTWRGDTFRAGRAHGEACIRDCCAEDSLAEVENELWGASTRGEAIERMSARWTNYVVRSKTRCGFIRRL